MNFVSLNVFVLCLKLILGGMSSGRSAFCSFGFDAFFAVSEPISTVNHRDVASERGK